MTKEKLISLNKYVSDLQNRLSSPVPAKHKDHPETYKDFLKHEIKMVTDKLEQVRLEGVTEAPKK